MIWPKGKSFSTEHRSKLSTSKKGHFSVEHKAKLSIAAIGRKHSNSSRANMRIAKLGKKLTSEHSSSISSGIRTHWISERHQARLCKCHEQRYCGTALEQALVQLLTCAGFVIEEQVRMGRYIVDVWIPNYGLVFEADGEYWHTLPGRQEHEKERDRYLLNRGVVAVVHLGEDIF